MLRDELRRWRTRAIDPSTGNSYERPAFAEASGIPYKTLEALENGGQKSINPEDAVRFARTAGVSVADICRAMDYPVERPDLTELEAEIVQILRRLPEEIQPDFVEAARQDARGAISMYRRLRGLPQVEPR